MPWALRTLLTIGLAATPLGLYVGLRCASSVGLLLPGWKRTARRVVFLLLLWFLSLPAYTFVLSQIGRTARHFILRPDVTWADYLLHYPFWFGVAVVIELTAITLTLDLAHLALRLFPTVRDRGRRLLAIVRVSAALLAMAYVPIRAIVDTAHVCDRTVDAHVDALPRELEGLVITLVSDIQVDRYTGDGKVQQVHAIVTRHTPDLLLSAGDLVTSGTTFLDAAARAVSGLSGRAGTVAVMGDHDQWSAPEEIRALHERSGWTFLDDRHTVIPYRGRTILITGLTHIYSRRLTGEELESFLSAGPSADLRVLLVHQPAPPVVDAAVRHGYDLVLAGHTHGGQIVGHPLGIPVTPSRFETPYYTGVTRLGKTTVVVTNGVGLTLAPIRYHAPAEVTTIVVRK